MYAGARPKGPILCVEFCLSVPILFKIDILRACVYALIIIE